MSKFETKIITDTPMQRVLSAINEADEVAARARVQHLRESYPHVTADALVGMLIKQKCLQSGAIGEVTSSASIIPGVGVFVSLIFGEAADAALTARLQAELVLEIAAAYQQPLAAAEQQSALLLVTGMSDNLNSLVSTTGQEVAQIANRQLAEQNSGQTTLQVSDTAGSNLVSTYLLGRRAEHYFKTGDPAAPACSNPEFIIPSLETQTLAGWLSETTQRSRQLISQRAWEATGLVLVAGQALGEVLPVAATTAKVSQSLSQGGQILWQVGEKTGPGLLEIVTDVADKVGNLAGPGLVNSSEAAVEIVAEVGKKTGQSLVEGAGKIGQFAASLMGWDKRTEKKRTDE
jgi:hypothetical protein